MAAEAKGVVDRLLYPLAIVEGHHLRHTWRKGVCLACGLAS